MYEHPADWTEVRTTPFSFTSVFQALPHTLRTNLVNLSVDDDNFVPNTKYAARVRSSPDQAFFKGHWSDWSSEVYWDTPPAVTGESPTSQLI